MKKLFYILILMILLSCNGENVPNCFQNSGNIIQKEFVVAPFTQITVFARIELIITEAPEQKVMVESGEYLMNDIEVKVENGRLKLYNNNACNLTRNYGLTKVFVSVPNLTEIRNSSGLTVSSNGVLNFETLAVISEDFNKGDISHTDGDFDLELNCINFSVVVNNLSSCYITGQTTKATIGFYAGDARFEGRNFMAQNVNIFQRGSNDMIINAQQSLKGEIRGTGDVIVVHTPPIVEVEQFYTGKLIYEN